MGWLLWARGCGLVAVCLVAMSQLLWFCRCGLVAVDRSFWVGRCGLVAMSWLLVGCCGSRYAQRGRVKFAQLLHCRESRPSKVERI